ncbi:MAG TPA: dihydrolipoamide acetyltransferase family protein, partial [Burkholderiales bacterium]|nr:dihydrolipoamide acetyltransferase family protein [Burkholderiales bacterium]
QLGETVTEGIVTRWYKKAGDSVKADETLFDVETDKVSTEIPAPASGVLAEILVEEGATAKVGVRLAVIRESGGAAAAASTAPAPVVAAVGAVSPAGGRPAAALQLPRANAVLRLSPVVRKLVAEHDLDPARISGTGRDGRITREDVMNFIARRGAAPQPAAPAAATPAPAMTAAAGTTTMPLSSVRKRVAENMARSWTTAPHVLQVAEADFYRVEQARQALGAEWKQREGFSLTYLPFIARAVSIALAKFPRLNATFNGDSLTLHRRINLGIAVDLNFEGLLVPVIKDVPGKSLPKIAIEINELSNKARAGKLRPDELAEGTYTITNNGAFGTVITAPIINQPQVAILSTDAIRKKPVVIEGPEGDSIAVRPIGVLAQTFDHRAIDGAYAAAFLREMKTIIETRHWVQDLQA